MVEAKTDSQWETGYCSTVSVTNVSMAQVTWKFKMTVKGKITQIWNATATSAGLEMVFQGVSWNGTIDPGQSAEFGYCAAL